MPNLSAADLDQVAAIAMQRYSAIWKEIPVTKAQLRAFFDIIDEELDSSENTIILAIPVGPQRTWLIANPEVGRDFITLTEDKRREVL